MNSFTYRYIDIDIYTKKMQRLCTDANPEGEHSKGHMEGPATHSAEPGGGEETVVMKALRRRR